MLSFQDIFQSCFTVTNFLHFSFLIVFFLFVCTFYFIFVLVLGRYHTEEKYSK